MNHIPKNTTFNSPKGKAELFFQVVNLDHYLTNYVVDLSKDLDKRSHDVPFTGIAKRLMGDVLIQSVVDRKNKYYAISLVENRYYYTVFYLSTRSDSEQLYAVIVTCYATNNKDVHRRYDDWLNAEKGKFRR
ncbi:MAG: hypothetical protein H7Z72_09845 [Bacteroidetes bacterium]|nr:hypothetical protein [Fibrella sp.]